MPDVKPPLWRTLTRAGILVGALTMLAGLALWDILDRARFASAAVLIPFGAGAVLVLAGLLLNLGWLRGGVRGRKFLVGLNVWAMVGLSVALLVISNAIVGGTPQTDAWSLDLTSNSVHTLSQKTRNILQGLHKEVSVTVFTSAGDPESEDTARRVNDMLDLYRAQTRKLHVETLDVYRDKVRAEQIALRIQKQSGANQVKINSILLECDKKSVNVSFSELFQMPAMDPMSMEAPAPGFMGEEKLTSAILSVTEEKQAAIYFLTGHGEMDISGAEGKALNQFVIELKRDNYRVEKLTLSKAGAVPADCDLIVIAGPTTPFPESDVQRLRGYLEKNGAMLVFALPRVLHGNLAGLGKLLADYNVQVRDGEVAIELHRDLLGQAYRDLRADITDQDYGSHPITEGLSAMTCIMEGVCPVAPAAIEPPRSPYGAPPEPASPWLATTLLKSSAQSWGETNLAEQPIKFDAGEDEKGPLSLGVAVLRRPPPASPYAPPPPEAAEPGPRLVVLGTPDIASDDVPGALIPQGLGNPGNVAFVKNAVNWLAKKETKLGIPAQRMDRRQITASPARMKAVFLISILGMPLAAVLAGGFVWWFRRR